jgi:hypothetical protein
MNSKHYAAPLLMVGISLALSACGGGGGGGSAPSAAGGGTPPPPPAPATEVTVVGPITGFGSVYVGGIRFDTNGARYELDDRAASDDSALSVGMVVKVKGTLDGDGRNGEAEAISYDDELEGRVENLAVDPTDDTLKNFTILGMQITADESTTVFRSDDDAGFGFASLADGDNVEISGYYDGDTLIATYVEKEDDNDDDVEVKGTVANAGGSGFDLTLADGSQLAVTLADGAAIPPAGIQNGQFVEVEGMIPDPGAVPLELVASKVELEDDDFLDEGDDEVEIEGVLTFDAAADAWTVFGTPLAFDSGTQYQPVGLRDAIADGTAEGRRAEVHGEHRNGALRVREIEIEGADDDRHGDDMEIRGLVQAIDPTDAVKVGTLTLGFPPLSDTIDVTVNEHTMFADDSAMQPFDLGDLSPGSSFAKVKVFRDASGDLVASRLEREDGSRYEIQATAEAYEDGVSITLLGVTFGLNAATEIDGVVPAAGDFVEVEDDDLDGIADELEREDD